MPLEKQRDGRSPFRGPDALSGCAAILAQVAAACMWTDPAAPAGEHMRPARLVRTASVLVAVMFTLGGVILHIPRLLAARDDPHEWATVFVALASSGPRGPSQVARRGDRDALRSAPLASSAWSRPHRARDATRRSRCVAAGADSPSTGSSSCSCASVPCPATYPLSRAATVDSMSSRGV
jgi:hypothetical protein